MILHSKGSQPEAALSFKKGDWQVIDVGGPMETFSLKSSAGLREN